MNNQQIGWFYELPENSNGKFYLVPPKGLEFEYLIEIQSISIKGEDFFLINYYGRDWILGLALFFYGFTGRFPDGSAGYSDGIIPFAVRFNNGIQATLFDLFMKMKRLSILYQPVYLLHQSKYLQIWYFI